MSNVNYISKRPLMIGAGCPDNFVGQKELPMAERNDYNGRGYILSYSRQMPLGEAEKMELLKLLDDSEVADFTSNMMGNIEHNFELDKVRGFAYSDNDKDRSKAYDYMVKNYIPSFLKAWCLFLTPKQFDSVKQGLKVKLNLA